MYLFNYGLCHVVAFVDNSMCYGSACIANSVMECVMFQLCTGGSVTDLVQGLKRRNERLTEDQIGYIIRETVEVMYIPTALRIECRK